MTAELYLASQSPRRRELLAQIGVVPRVLTLDIDESRRDDEPAADYVQRLAREKAEAGWQQVNSAGLSLGPVLGADTAVVVDGAILGKPIDAADGRATLQRLSGRAHEVLTGVAVCGPHGVQVQMSRTLVWFRGLSAAEIDAYWASGEPCDKAGGYGIQGLAAVFIERIEGSYSGVVGLPLFETAALLHAYGVVSGGIVAGGTQSPSKAIEK
jgi:septum formation protein